MYKSYKSIDGKKDAGVIFNNQKAIPFDPANTDYQTYLEWVAEGNQPEPAENT